MEKRGGLGAGGPNTYTDTTLTGPPSSTHTKDRHIHPAIQGSTGGLIGLIVGIAVVLVLGVIGGFWLYNRRRRRRRLIAGTSRPARLGVNVSRDGRLDDDWDPYADPIPSPHDGGNRPMYARAKSEEWEIPHDTLHTPRATDGRPRSPFSSSRAGQGGADGLQEPGETTAPIRSRSPRLSPRTFDRELPGQKGKGKQREEAENPFESELDPGRLSPRMEHRDL